MNPFALRPLRALLVCSALVSTVHVCAQSDQIEVHGTRALPFETTIIPSLRGIICLPDATAVNEPVPAGFTGLDTSRTPLLQNQDAEIWLKLFLDEPTSFGSLERLTLGLRTCLRVTGQPFVAAYVPPQDVSAGVIRLVVQRAKLEGGLAIEGARWFPEDDYRRTLPLQAGSEIDAAAVTAGVNWINENPYRRTTLMAAPGETPGTTRLTLRVEDQRPWRLTAGYSNSGTPVTDEDRVSASVAWGNAFGRGDQFGYSFTADPSLDHSLSHSANYTTIFRSRSSLTLYGSWSRIESELPEPLTQAGTSWQTGLRFGVPLKPRREGWTESLAFTADFKASDNTLEFAAIPITDNLTHVVQFGATYAVSFRALGGQNGVSVSGYASPGGLTSRNHGRYFDASRFGAKARYAYARIGLSHQRPLARGFSWQTAIDAQFASGALLGSEQLNGGGASAVRGYRESSAFGDWGVVANNELHLRPLRLSGNGGIDFFGFFDLASLRLKVDDTSTDLQSAGIGLNGQWGRALSVRASYGWRLKEIDTSRGRSKGHGHVAANVSF
jgi:hemolysin activation/secretion protein